MRVSGVERVSTYRVRGRFGGGGSSNAGREAKQYSCTRVWEEQYCEGVVGGKMYGRKWVGGQSSR